MNEVLEALGYEGSKNFIRSGSKDFVSAVDHVHVLRKAAEECGLQGIYALRPDSQSSQGIVPVVYVCEADDETEARAIHKQVWNQNIVPFLLVLTRGIARLYASFQYTDDSPDRGVLESAVAFNEIADRLAWLQAHAIDTGKVWEKWGEFVTPDTRVDRQLLEHLSQLDSMLQGEGLDRAISHALIGKFVYLRYLRDRDILSDRKLHNWGISYDSVFTSRATLASFWAIDERLDKELNGAVFPLASKRRAITSRHLQRTAGVFFGDAPKGQRHLNFQAYDFSFIPTELLSSVYEQFLHAPSPGEKVTRGKRLGAYYTPVPLINFTLGELEEKKPLKEGMKVLDPACGSGAFLVQCYRRLIELRKSQSNSPKLRPTELRKLLTDHIYGVESDGDACQIAELSLLLTLLDNVKPPDLENTTFRLPVLHNRNIFEADFFDAQSVFTKSCDAVSFDWIVGNPPWKELSSSDLSSSDQNTWQWIKANVNEYPVGGHQVAEAFAWKATQYVSARGVIGLVLPAMTLFKGESAGFRRKLFSEMTVWCVANFANLAYVLFAGRAQAPAALFFYSPGEPKPDDAILTYAPFVINQEANRPDMPGKKQATWNIVVNADELRDVPVREAAAGDMLPWKIAMWGSRRDQRLLGRIEGRFPSSLAEFCAKHDLQVNQGFDIRRESQNDCGAYQPDLVGRLRIDVTALKGCGRIFCFPQRALQPIAREEAYLRVNRGQPGLAVSRGPHIIVDASRRFAVYSSEFLAVPTRLIGIAGPAGTEAVLKALSLYLSSDFTTYHQFFACPEWGINTSRATLHGLKVLPVPFGSLSPARLSKWERLHNVLAATPNAEDRNLLGGDRSSENMAARLRELNELVFDLLDVRPAERRIVTDFVNERMQLLKGKVTKNAVRSPTRDEMMAYSKVLKRELDGFIRPCSRSHKITAFFSDSSGVVDIELVKSPRRGGVAVSSVTADTARELHKARANLRRKHSQWLYFDRNLRIYDGPHTYVFKPIQRAHWTATQAMLDADEIISETLMST